MNLRTTPASSMLPGVTVAVETILLGALDGRLTYRAASGALGDDEHPDAAARRLAAPGVTLLHSTSWRFAKGTIVLTYAALPDPDPAGATILPADAATSGGADPLSPSPSHVDQVNVVAHACRHLAFLRVVDPLVASHTDGLWALLEAFRPDVAGQR